MKRIEFNELIEKAFSMGYKMGQKEFGAVKRENKKKKREWLEKLGKEETNYNGQEKVAQRINDKEYWRQLKKNPFEAIKYIGGPTREQINSVSKTDGNVNAGRYNIKYRRSGNETINDVINERLREKRGSDRDLEIFNKKKIKDIKDAEKYDFKLEKSYLKNQLKNKKNKLKEELEKKENLKKAGLALAGTAAAAGIAYGAKKLYDKRKKAREEAKKNKEQNKKEED